MEVPHKEQRVKIKESLERELMLLLLEKRMAYVTFTIQFTEMILPDPKTGKKKLIVKNSEESNEGTEVLKVPKVLYESVG